MQAGEPQAEGPGDDYGSDRRRSRVPRHRVRARLAQPHDVRGTRRYKGGQDQATGRPQDQMAQRSVGRCDQRRPGSGFLGLAEPALTEPALTEPALTEPPLTEPALTEPALTEPALTRGAGCRAAVY
jgi:hypothetical protein